MVMELLENSPGKENEGSINPVLGLVWWLFFWAPQALWMIMMFGVVGDPSDAINDPDGFVQGLAFVMALGLALNALSLGCMVAIVSKVTDYQDRRLVPTQDQLELFERQEHERATFAGNAHLAEGAKSFSI